MSWSLPSQAILRKVQDSAMMLKRDAEMKKRVLEAKQKYGEILEIAWQHSASVETFSVSFQ